MKFAVIPNLSRDGALAVTEGITKTLASLGAGCVFSEEYFGSFGGSGVEFADIDSAIPSCDAVIAVGGDATIIHAAKKAAACGKHILGINAGRLAFMAGLEGNELDKLSCLISGEYSIDSRLMLKVEIRNGDTVLCSDYCVNDAFISGDSGLRMEAVDVYLGERFVNSYLADGVLVATPTGSTAYSLSAGGSVVDPELESILLTPVCSHSLFDRPLVLKPDAVLKIESHVNKLLKVSLDGQEHLHIEPGCIAVVSQAGYKAQFIRIKSDNFIDILGRKLAQRKDF